MPARFPTSEEEIKLLARLMLAEARTEGRLGMDLVGRVVENRRISQCEDFKNINRLKDVIFQRYGRRGGYHFEVVSNRLIDKQRIDPETFESARNIVKGKAIGTQARNSLWFHNPGMRIKGCPPTFPTAKTKHYKKFGQHCFYQIICTYCPHFCVK